MARLPMDRGPALSQFLRFLAVGTIGFAVDAGIVTALVRLAQWDPYGSRVLSFAAAVTVTWCLNRRFTFASVAASEARRRAEEYSRYLGVQLGGALINFAIYGLLVTLYDAAARHPAVPVAFGSAAALAFNFLGARYFAFADPTVLALARPPGQTVQPAPPRPATDTGTADDP